MKRILLLTFLCFTIGTSWSQRSQIIAYMDMEYILENVPEYLEAQNTLDKKSCKMAREIRQRSTVYRSA